MTTSSKTNKDMEELRKEFFGKFADWHNMDIEDVWSWIESKIVQAKEAGREEGLAIGFMNGASQGFGKEDPRPKQELKSK